MVWFWTILLLLCFLISYLLLAPFYLEINSNRDLYRIRFHRLASARLITTDSSLIVELNVAWWHKKIDLLQQKVVAHPKKDSSIPKVKKAGNFPFMKLKSVIRSFKVNKCRLSLDTGNMQLNGFLYPFFYWLGFLTKKPIGINFVEHNEIVLEIENNLARMINAFIFNKSSKKTQGHGQLK